VCVNIYNRTLTHY